MVIPVMLFQDLFNSDTCLACFQRYPLLQNIIEIARHIKHPIQIGYMH
jgi:hypothetical protein